MKNFLKLMGDTKLQVQEGQTTPNRVNAKNINLGMSYLNLRKSKVKKNIERSQRSETTFVQRSKDKDIISFSEVRQARSTGNQIFSAVQEKNKKQCTNLQNKPHSGP